ncbi:MAG: thiol-disulfide isomerase [Flavobacteriaceae bacterium]|nr:MAG: thiol-disulfide isomerase [Flavobacteriaceae bacterium]
MKQSLIILLLLISYQGFSQNWTTNFEKAKDQSALQDKKIVLVFSGSDWCGPCIKLEKEIWQSHEFISFADENLILLKADFPRKKKNKLSKEQQIQNDMLAEKYHARFPWIVVLDSKGNVLDAFGFVKNYTPQDYINRISKINI